jgi:hypothetical protein
VPEEQPSRVLTALYRACKATSAPAAIVLRATPLAARRTRCHDRRVSAEPPDDRDEGRDAREFFYPPDDQEAPAPGWLGGLAQMAAAALIVALILALFVGGAILLRRVIPG